MTPENLKREELTAEQLLDLDDDSFAQALESSYGGSRQNSANQASFLLGPSDGMLTNNAASQAQSNPNSHSQATINPFEMPSTGYLQDPFDELSAPAAGNGMGIANDLSFTDPFTDPFASNPVDLKASGEAARPPAERMIHPIAIPGRTFSDLQMGAKPVMPGTLAPQFENQPAKNPGDRQQEARNATAQSTKDPFDDLF